MQKEENQSNHDKVFEAPKILNTYLGQKGYTLYKNELTIEQQKFIKKELTVKPYTPGMNQQNTKTFPAFREVDKKLYVPRYFGEKYFGKPTESKIALGQDINIEFSLSLYIVSQLKKKTLVIVHKEFLMNQWIERIQQFLPSARVGKIQGQIVDIENKDIVLGMLQSLSMKDYPATMFDSFGLTIIDEVHHISSEVFSCALFKLVTNYTLGLSATMNRKDGTTHIFKLFLGDIIHKEVRGKDDAVLVRALEYESNNEEFNTVEYDYRGQAKYSTMISKLCEFSARTEFILRVIKDMLTENNSQQIMVIAHNKNVLKYIFDAIQHRKITTVGYYVGGMKEAALKESEGKQVIIATYSMAAEALDIKTLTTLVMVTPKTDIEQAVGRILRAKHSTPVVVDIIDQHDPFQNQWKKRKAYYIKNNYKIIQTGSSTYDADITKWDVIYEPGTLTKKACTRAPKIKPTSEEALQGKCLIKIKKSVEE